MKADRFDKLLAFLDRLENAKITYRVSKHLYDAISVEVYAPSEHWEVDFFADGDVYVERFRSDGHIDDEAVLDELFKLCSDEESQPTDAIRRNDATAEK